MRKPLLVAAGIVLFLVLASIVNIFDRRGPWTNGWCERDIQDEAVSPAGGLTARAVLFACGVVGPVSWTAVAIVKTGRTPSQDDEVLVGDIARRGIKLKWTAPDQLEIYLSEFVSIDSYKAEHAGVKISLMRGRP